MNYYAVFDPCPNCGRGSRLHIGKSSVGWTFSFHAIDEFEAQEAGLVEKIDSYSKWTDALHGAVVRIFDEDDCRITILEFESLVASKRKADLNHSIEAQKEGWPHCFLDPDGHSFSTGEFS